MSDQSSSPRTLVSLGRFGDRAYAHRAELHEAALVIGLGYVGLQALGQTRYMLGKLVAGRELQTKIRLMAIFRRRTFREEEIVPREERLSLDMDPVSWDTVPGRYAAAGVGQWWLHRPRDPEIAENPRQTRAYNRLLLFSNAELVSTTLYKLAQWLQGVGTGRKLSIPRRIYLLVSLAEAEGSGMLFDVASRLRDLMSHHPATVTGVFTLRAQVGTPDSERTRAMANAYATLCELDACTLHPDAFRSTLPAIGHSLARPASRPALDMILLTDDAATDAPEDPAGVLAECVTNWVAASLFEPDQAPDLPRPAPIEAGTDRFQGYSTFGVSKLALPTGTAMNWAAVRLGRTALKALMHTHPGVTTAGWVDTVLERARAAILNYHLSGAPDVTERTRSWQYDLSSAGLIRKLEDRAANGESDRMLDLVQLEARRLQLELHGEHSPPQGIARAGSDSIRMRMDGVLAASTRDLSAQLEAAPVDLAYVRGLGLIWTLSALEELERQARSLLPDLQRVARSNEDAYKLARRALMACARDYDARSGGRFGRGRKAPPTDLDERASALLSTALALVETQAKLFVWTELCAVIDELGGQVREALPLVDRAAGELDEFEETARRALLAASNQAEVCFPAGVAVTGQWYVDGTQKLDEFDDLPSQQLLSLVFKAWGPPESVQPERRLLQFLREIRVALRRALAGYFEFPDLPDFLEDNIEDPVYMRALAELPDAAMPALEPIADAQHPPPAWYEIVRQPPRQVPGLGAAPPGIVRTFLPSPDPDEITFMRVLHGMMVEAIPAVREAYRRAYQRASADGLPLHIDRRWDATMADLVHTTMRQEISAIWERILSTLHANPQHIDDPLKALVNAFGTALDVTGVTYTPNMSPDLRLAVYKLRPFRLKLPPPQCAVLFVFSNRKASEIGEEAVRAISALPLEEPFAFVVNITNRSDIDQIVAPLRNMNHIVLTLNERDVKQLIGARQPTRALSDLVLNRASLVTVSPFYTRGPVPEHMFFGREREIAEVRSKLRTHSVALIGGRRIGKTSTLQRIKRLLETPDSGSVPYYLDCHGATDYRSFFYLVGTRWEVDIREDASTVEFEKAVRELRARHPGQNIVLLFDEVDSLLRFDHRDENQERLFRTFRSLSNEKYCQYVFSGEKWLLRGIVDSYSALFNFTQAVQLKPLPEGVVRQLVALPFEMLNIWMEEPERIIERVYKISAGHPNIVQIICQSMVHQLDEDKESANLLRYGHLEQAIEGYELQEEIVNTIWGQMSPLAKLITLLWPPDSYSLTLPDLEGLLASVGIDRVPPERMHRTAKDLELYCFVVPAKNGRLRLLPTQFSDILADFMRDNRDWNIEALRQLYREDPDGLGSR